MKLKLLIIFLTLNLISYAKIEVKIFEHMKFKEINSTNLKEAVVGKGILQIEAEKEDYGKIIELTFLDKGLMTNGRNPIQVEKFGVANKKDEKFVVDRRSRQIEFYAVIDKRKIGRKRLDANMLEGKYVGAMPIMINIYPPENNKENN